MRLSALLLATTLALPAQTALAQSFSEEDIKQLALDAIIENPDIIMEAIAILQQREEQDSAAQARAALEANRDKLFEDPNAPVLGNPEGDITVVEFFDYNCPYCRRAGDEIKALLAVDPNIRIVYREWPILGEGSVVASRAALAARAQDKYLEFHEAMMGGQARLDEAQVMRIAGEVGLDVEKLRADMESEAVSAHLTASTELARALGFNGTPSFVIGEELSYGALSAEDISAIIAAQRAARDG